MPKAKSSRIAKKRSKPTASGEGKKPRSIEDHMKLLMGILEEAAARHEQIDPSVGHTITVQRLQPTGETSVKKQGTAKKKAARPNRSRREQTRRG